MRSIQADINATSSSGREKDIPAGQPRCWGDAGKGGKRLQVRRQGCGVRFPHPGKE